MKLGDIEETNSVPGTTTSIYLCPFSPVNSLASATRQRETSAVGKGAILGGLGIDGLVNVWSYSDGNTFDWRQTVCWESVGNLVGKSKLLK